MNWAVGGERANLDAASEALALGGRQDAGLLRVLGKSLVKEDSFGKH